LSDIRIPENVGDFRLMDRRVVESISKLPESRRFMKGLFSWVGYKTDVVEYRRPERLVGTTKFNGWKLWNFALEGITSFSTAPLRIWTYLGLFASMFSFVYGSFLFARTLLYGADTPGYASVMVSILFLGGVQLIGIGVLGEYIGRIYMEAKHRPVYLVDTIIRGKAISQ
jgi:glycosyltransferase involved in cell wall biosynthesis